MTVVTAARRTSSGSGSAPLPRPRGPLSRALLAHLVAAPGPDTSAWAELADGVGDDVCDDPDAQLTLWCLDELHYRGLVGVDDAWEWHPGPQALRRALEAAFEARLRVLAGDLPDRFARTAHADGLPAAFDAVAAALPGAGVSRYVQGSITWAQWQEFLVCKSVYQLKEADPHSWAIPRVWGEAKSALVDIQYDEYGAGRPERQHARLFESTMTASGLDASYGRYVEDVPAAVLALNNLMSMLGLHRRLTGALLGQLALYESTSCLPNKHYAAGARRLGLDDAGVDYFTEHVEADAIHEQVALEQMLGGYLRQHPDRAAVVGFGVVAGTLLDNAVAEGQLTAWRAGRSYLTVPTGAEGPAVATGWAS